mmetsp:Transcript_12493/g.24898  ORF Transcript_12493/g.24898 Transcript_12493/m.24898 type:complete len:363 (+) Transcript_12493:115-1203(+)
MFLNRRKLPSKSTTQHNARKSLARRSLAFIVFVILGFLFTSHGKLFRLLQQEERIDIKVSSACTVLPKIRPSGSIFFRDQKCKRAKSKDGIVPEFNFGSFIEPKRVTHHMTGDLPSFQLIREYHERHSGATSAALDVGANQGFFTYFLASLGLEVHSFEINKENFVALQHGIIFNAPEVSDRVNLYSMGLSDKEGRQGIQGGSYEGFLKNSDDGEILSTSFDCFAHHTQLLSMKELSFVKIDVEGFEIKVLEGAKQSLFAPNVRIGSLLMEVGPSRWSRSGVTLEEGVAAMLDLSTHFKESYVMFRKGDTCPGAKLKDMLSASSPHRTLFDVEIYKVRPSEWNKLLTQMNALKSDCNFWYTN